jgi:hypothetical protein
VLAYVSQVLIQDGFIHSGTAREFGENFESGNFVFIGIYQELDIGVIYENQLFYKQLSENHNRIQEVQRIEELIAKAESEFLAIISSDHYEDLTNV